MVFLEEQQQQNTVYCRFMVHSTSVTLCPAFGIRITSSINLSFPGEPFPQLINVTKQIGMCNCAGVWIKKEFVVCLLLGVELE